MEIAVEMADFNNSNERVNLPVLQLQVHQSKFIPMADVGAWVLPLDSIDVGF